MKNIPLIAWAAAGFVVYQLFFAQKASAAVPVLPTVAPNTPVAHDPVFQDNMDYYISQI